MPSYIVNGYPGSGKSTFESFVQSMAPNGCVMQISTIDGIKSIARDHFDWNGEKTPKARKFLSDLKHLATEWNDYPYNYIMRRVTLHEYQLASSLYKPVFFIDCREPEEIDKLKKALNAKTILIQRAAHEQELSNDADQNVLNYTYDIIINNDSTLEDLKEKAKHFMQDEHIEIYDN